MKVIIKLKDKETGVVSEPVSIEDIIFNQNEVVFIFDEYDTDTFNGEFALQLSYKDFLFFRDDYEVIVKVEE